MMTESEVGALLDAHDALVKACVGTIPRVCAVTPIVSFPRSDC